MWISNAGFADVMIVFAKIDQDKNLTAFIVEKDFPGITLGEEEKKLGIKGSSTRQVFFNQTPVPVENMLSARENGFKIAVNILNIGRIKLAAAVIGGCKTVISQSVAYANERKQFGTPISSFGAIQHKLAEMAIRTWVTESACYRAGQNIEDKIHELHSAGASKEEAILKGVEQFAIECALLKVYGSETLGYVCDEGVQIYGGMGFSADAPMERAYRDARITRIYEGTNEINRMLLVGMIFKRAMGGQLNLLGPAMAVAKELTSLPDMGEEPQGFLAAEKKVLQNLKKAVLMVAGKAAQDLGMRLNDEQEILGYLADMVIYIYMAESAILRAEKLSLTDPSAAYLPERIARVFVQEAADQISLAGRSALAAFASEDEAGVLMMGLKRFTKMPLVNTVKLRREIAARLIEAGSYTA
jgi:alkylation response protein AidB-like acyl-CoA dehydrogenase